MKKIIISLVVILFLSGCGAIDRATSKIIGGATETCHDGVLYLQFTSGASVKYNKDGSIATC